jgi:hypothetical protein
MGQIRHALSTAFALYSLIFIYEEKPCKFFIIVTLAFLFHYSAFLFYLAYPIAKIKGLKNPVAVILLISFALVLGAINIVPLIDSGCKILIPDQLAYKDYLLHKIKLTNSSANLLTLGKAWYILTYVFLWFFYKKFSNIQVFSNGLLNFYLVGIFIYVAFTSFPPIAARLSQPFLLVSVILIPNLVNVFKPRWVSKICVSCLIVVYTLSNITQTLVIRYDAFLPYKTILSHFLK